LRTLFITNVLLWFGFNIWRGLFNNFAVEELGVRADQIGLIQSIREVPGLLGFWLAFLALVLVETEVLSLSVILLGIGMIATGLSHTWTTLVIGTLITSVGFHAFYPNSSSVALMVTDKRGAAPLLGRLGGVGALAAVVAMGSIYLLFKHLGFRNLFVWTGVLVMVGGALTWRRQPRRDGEERRRKVVLRRRYWLYYVLTFLMGSRRHIFTTFAIFLLVKNFGLPTQQTALLYLVNSVLNVFAAPRAGKLVARYGERATLTLTFGLLIGIFVGYATLNSLLVLEVLFVLDNLLFSFGVALNSYFKRIAVSEEEITSNLSLAQTINHIAAIFVPVAGGLIWEAFGASTTFAAGAAIVFVSLILTQFIRPEVAASAPAPTIAT